MRWRRRSTGSASNSSFASSPSAKHLRFAYVTIKINQEVERIGDYAESIARQIIKVSNLNTPVPLDRYRQIAELSIPMLRDAVLAYLTENADLARRLGVVEEEVDGLKSVINAELFQLRQENKIPLEALNPLMTIARRFERVSDQAKNICEETLYMVTGEYQKHAGGDVWRVLFIDEHNSCRSQMAEAIANSLGQPKFMFASAGLDPKPVDPATAAFLKEKGVDLSYAVSRGVESIPNLENYQIIVALAKGSPTRFSREDQIHLPGLEHPGSVESDGHRVRRIRKAYEEAYHQLYSQIQDLVEGILSDKID